MLRVSAAPGSQGETGTRFLSVDTHRKQITIFDPSASGYVTSANRRTGIAAPKMFAFDAVFSPDDSLVRDENFSARSPPPTPPSLPPPSLSHCFCFCLSLSLSPHTHTLSTNFPTVVFVEQEDGSGRGHTTSSDFRSASLPVMVKAVLERGSGETD